MFIISEADEFLWIKIISINIEFYYNYCIFIENIRINESLNIQVIESEQSHKSRHS